MISHQLHISAIIKNWAKIESSFLQVSFYLSSCLVRLSIFHALLWLFQVIVQNVGMISQKSSNVQYLLGFLSTFWQSVPFQCWLQTCLGSLASILDVLHQRVEGQGINSLTHFLIFQQTFWFSTFRSIYHDISNSIPTTALIRTKKKLSNNQLSNTAQDHKSIIKVQYLLMNKLDTKQIAQW